MRKQIVHNKHVVHDAARPQGAIFVEENDEVPEGVIVIFSAHGVAPEVHEQAARPRRCKAIDATCPLVTKVHQEAKRFAAEDYDILLIGHEGHEEVIGTAGEAPDHIQLVDGPDDVDKVTVRDPSKVVWLSQTTLSVDETMETVGPAQDPAAAAAVAAQRRHLLRHLEPAARGQGDRRRVRRGDRGRLARTRPTRCAWSRWRWTPAPAPGYLVDYAHEIDDAWLTAPPRSA